jgi:hypothetical protein
MNQLQMFYREQRRIGEKDAIFMELIRHPTNPLTNDDLRKMVARWPDRYGKYAGFVGKLSA